MMYADEVMRFTEAEKYVLETLRCHGPREIEVEDYD